MTSTDFRQGTDELWEPGREPLDQPFTESQVTLDLARSLKFQAVKAQEAAARIVARRDQAIRAAVAEHGIRPVAMALGMNPGDVHRIARKEQS